jgi:hypothetical protein
MAMLYIASNPTTTQKQCSQVVQRRPKGSKGPSASVPLALSRACRGVAASSASLFRRALEAGLQDDVRGDFEPRQHDDEIEKSERGRERSSFRDELASEIRSATSDRRREPRPGIVHGRLHGMNEFSKHPHLNAARLQRAL